MKLIDILPDMMGNPEISPERIEAIRKTKRENPEANQKWIAVMSFESEYAVGVALKDFSL